MPRPRLGPLANLWSKADSTDSGTAGGAYGLPCGVHFLQAKGPMEAGPELRGRPTMILTNVPYGSKALNRSAPRDYEEFGRLLREELQPGGLRAVYCLSA